MIVPRFIAQLARLLLCIAAVPLLEGGPAYAQMSFQHVVVDAVGPRDIWGKSVGDLNHDGLPDLIAGGRSGGGLVWYENPSWTKRTIASGGQFSTDHEVCDVNGDGQNDVVSLQQSLYWYEGPTWVEHLIANEVLHDIEVLDFDGDGDCDIAARNQSNFGSSGATLYLYTQISPTSWDRTTQTIPDGEGLVAADIDGDEDLDLVLNEVWVENEGVSPETWAQHVYTTAWTHDAAFVAVADMDADGHLDVLLSPSELKGESYRISWFEAPDDPKQPGWSEHVVDGTVEAVHHFVGAGDFDRDGDMDVAAAEMEQGGDPDEVKIYRNDGASFTKVVISNDGSHSMRVVDIDLDGDLDLFGANWQGDQVDLYVNQTPPSPLGLDVWERHVLDANRPGRAIFVAADDLDGDDRVDVAAGGYWYRNPGSASGSWARSAFGAPLNNLAVLHDLDGDGDTDVLGTEGIGSEAAPDFVFGRNDGQGNFSRIADVATGSGDFLQGVTVARMSPGEQKSVVLSWHNGAAAIEALLVPSNPSTGLWSLESFGVQSQDEALDHGDIDRDGDQDLLLGTVWLDNLGSTFSSKTLFPTGDAPDRNRLADIDRDGRLDAVVGYEAISTTGVVAWYKQPANPAGTWSQTIIAQVTGPMSLDVADMDRDGDLDVVVGEHDLSSPGTAGLFVFENADGVGGTWTQHTVYLGDEHHDGAQVVDIDGDGDLDIISIGWGHARVLLYENKGVAGSGGGPDPDPDPDPGSNLDLLAAWGFAGTGPYVADTTGNGNTGYLEDGATRSEIGYHGKGLEVDGVAGHVNLGLYDVASEDLTIMAWINADDFGTPDARILSKSTGSAASDHVWMLSTIQGPHARFRLKTDDGNITTTLVGSGGTLTAGVWYHIAATYDGNRMRLYQDGIEVASAPKTGGVFQAPAVEAYIGANPGASNQVFDGRIDDVKVFGRALTCDEIAVEMTTPASPPPPPVYSCSIGSMHDRVRDIFMWLMVALAALALRATRRRRR